MTASEPFNVMVAECERVQQEQSPSTSTTAAEIDSDSHSPSAVFQDRAQAANRSLIQALKVLGSDQQFSKAASDVLRACDTLCALRREGSLR